MTKCYGVINAAAQGLTSSSMHPHFADVNPIKKQTVDWREKRLQWAIDDHKSRQRQKAIVKANPRSRILPDLSK